MSKPICTLALLLSVAAPAMAATNVVATSAQIRSFLGGRTGKVVYIDRQAGNRCYWIDLNDMSVHLLADETNIEEPLLSPDGSRVVYGRTSIVSKWPGQSSGNVGNAYIRALAGGDRTKVAGASVAGRQAFSPHWWFNPASGDEYIVTMDYYEKDTQSASGRGTWKQRIVNNAPVGSPIKILDHAFDGGLSADGRKVGEGYHFLHLANTKDLGGGNGWSISSRLAGGAQACNASMSPDNNYYVMQLADGHAGAAIRNGSDTRVRWIPKPSGSAEMQHPEYSTDPGFSTFTAQYGSSYRIFIANTSNGASIEVARGDFNHPHLWVGEAEPAMSLQPSALAFQAGLGGTDPPPQQVEVRNTGAETLATVTATSSQTWLTVSVSGDGNQQVISNEVDIAGLAEGGHTANVSVSSANASNSPASYDVTLSVGAAAVATTVTVTPNGSAIVPYGVLDLTASVTDQYGAPVSAIVSWETDGGGSLLATQAGVPDSEHEAMLVSDGTEGTFTVTATAGELAGEAEVTVAMRPPTHIPVNCGANSLDVNGWERDNSYVSGGEDWTNDQNVSIAGVADAAPATVYRSVRHCITSTGSCPRFDFDDLDDGVYTVRLHFADKYAGPRHINVTIEGNQVLSNFDIASSAGGTNRAVVETFSVVVSDGDGMTIQVSTNDGDGFVSGIEIVAGGDTTAPEVTITNPTEGATVAGELTIAGTATDPQGVAAVLVQLDDDPWLPATGTAEWQLTLDETDLTGGAHVISARATDVFGNTTTASVTITVEAAAMAEILIMAPMGGEKWVTGSTREIRWTAVGVDDVSLAYSTGDDAFVVIESSVDRAHPGWSAYVWQVPSEPCDACRIKIEGYFREAQAISREFSIVAAPTTTPPADDPAAIVGGCGCQSIGLEHWLAALIVVVAGPWPRRRRQ